MSTDSPVAPIHSVEGMGSGPNGQIILFGDSITEEAFDVKGCFSNGAALSHGTPVHARYPILFKVIVFVYNNAQCLSMEAYAVEIPAYKRRLDVINRGFS
jgi:hypothetical protein